MVNVEWALRSAWFLNTNLSNLTKFSPRGGFCFPTRISRISLIFTSSEFFPVRHSENRCLQRRRSVGSVRSVWDFSFWITMQRYNISFSQFTDAHCCSPILTDFDSFGVFPLRPNENTRCLQRKNKSARSVRSVCDLNTIRNHDT